MKRRKKAATSAEDERLKVLLAPDTDEDIERSVSAERRRFAVLDRRVSTAEYYARRETAAQSWMKGR